MSTNTPLQPLDTESEHDTLRRLLLENQQLLRENHLLLKKLERYSRWGLISRVIWYTIIIGAPFLLYYYLVEPYFAAFQTDFAQFKAGLEQIPGWNLWHAGNME